MKFFHANSSDSSNASLRLIAEHEDIYPHHLGRIIESETKFEGPLCGWSIRSAKQNAWMERSATYARSLPAVKALILTAYAIDVIITVF